MRFDAFAHTPRPLETCFKKPKKTSGEVTNAFWCMCAYFQTFRNMFLKNLFFKSGDVKKSVLMHLHTLPEH